MEALRVSIEIFPAAEREFFQHIVCSKGKASTEPYGLDVGNYLAGKAPTQVTPGVKSLEGQYVDDLGRVQPWKAYYDEYGRLIGRTDYNAGNIKQKIPNAHYYTYRWEPGENPSQSGKHIEGEFKP